MAVCCSLRLQMVYRWGVWGQLRAIVSLPHFLELAAVAGAHHEAQVRNSDLFCSLLALLGGACASQSAPPPSAANAAAITPNAPDEPRTLTPPLLPAAREPMPGVTTGGKPSAQQLMAAKQSGVRSVISLLPEAQTADEAAEARRLGLSFTSIPIADASALTPDNAARLASAMDAPGAKPLLLHCDSGDRTGALLALRAYYVDHASSEAALLLGASAGMTSLRTQVESQLKAASATP